MTAARVAGVPNPFLSASSGISSLPAVSMADKSVSSVKCLGGVVLPSLTAQEETESDCPSEAGGCCPACHFPCMPSNPYEGLFSPWRQRHSAAVQPCLGLQIDEGCADRHKHMTGNKAQDFPFACGQRLQVRFARCHGGNDGVVVADLFLLLHTCPEQTAAGGSVPQMPTQHSASAFTPPSISSVR